MGFLSGITKTLFGGSDSSSSSQSGWSMLPQQIKDAYTGFATNVSNRLPNTTAAFTPLAQTADETAGINRMRQGFAPTADSLKTDISMFMNPYNDFVIGDVNRQAGGDYSILKQAMNEAGQFGSNRQMLGANDIEQTRLNTIGKLRAEEYNNAIGNVFNNLIPQRQADTQSLMNIGEFQRGLAGQTAQAPITGLQEIAKALGILPTDGGSTSTSKSSQQNGIFKSIGL